MGMLILLNIVNLLAAAIDGFQETNVTDKQPYAYTKVVYTAGGTIKDNKTSGITVTNSPGCYRTQIKGKNTNGFTAGTLDLSFWGDKAFSLPSNNSVYTVSATNSLTQTLPTGTDSSAIFQLNIPQGQTEFCITIDQNPFIGVAINSAGAAPQLDVTAQNLPDQAVADFTINEFLPTPEVVPMEFATSADKSYTELIFECSRALFRACVETAVVDCGDKIGAAVKKISLCCRLQKIRDFLAKRCESICIIPSKKYPVPCPPQPCPKPVPPVTPVHPVAPVCPPVQQPSGPGPQQVVHEPVTQTFFLDVCIKASIILTQMGSAPYVSLFPHVQKPYSQYIAECDKVCFPSSSGYSAGYGGAAHPSYAVRSTQKPTTKTVPAKPCDKKSEKKKTEKKDESDSSSEDEKDKEGYSAGTYIAGGLGAVVVVSVCVYVGYQVMA